MQESEIIVIYGKVHYMNGEVDNLVVDIAETGDPPTYFEEFIDRFFKFERLPYSTAINPIVRLRFHVLNMNLIRRIDFTWSTGYDPDEDAS